MASTCRCSAFKPVITTNSSSSAVMIKIWSMKAKEAAAEKKKPKTSAAQIRVQKGKLSCLSLHYSQLHHNGFPNVPFFSSLDLAELEIPSTIEMTFPDPADILNFEVKISPDDGMLQLQLLTSESQSLTHLLSALRLGFYKGGRFHFTFNINTNYPHEPPKVRCTQKVS
jgi:ubiquitin-conjugating enzyme E2 M